MAGAKGAAGLDEEVSRRYQEMRVAYLQQVRELVPALTDAGEQAGDRAGLVELRRQVHRLRGSAGFYGYPEIGTSAASLEDWVVAVLDGDTHLTPERLQQLLGSLLATIAAAQPPAGLWGKENPPG